MTAAPLWRDVEDPPPEIDRRRRNALVLLAVVAVLALLMGLGYAATRDDEPRDPAASDPTTSPPSSQPPSTSEPPPSSEPAETQSAGVPAGFTLHEDETGFVVAVPDGWEPVRDGSRVDFQEPGGSRFLRVDQTDDPKDDAEKDWQEQEKSVKDNEDDFPDYERIRIDSVEYRDYEAADWEFTFGDAPTHVVNRGMNTGEMGYALYFSAPDSQWEESQSILETVYDTFQPAG